MEKTSWLAILLVISGLAALCAAATAGIMQGIQEWAWGVGGAGVLLIFMGFAVESLGAAKARRR